MWGRAGQIVLSVIAVVLLYPAHAILEYQAVARPYIAEGRAFAEFPSGKLPVLTEPVRRVTTHSYVRQVSVSYAAPSERTAVIVGINNAPGSAPLPGSVADAMNLRSALTGYGFESKNITMLLDGRATRPAILSELRSLAARTSPNGVAVFAIAAHTTRARGMNHLITAEGGRISSRELAAHLSAIRSPAWIALPTCYAAGYALPGIVGFNRIATFASAPNAQSYQMGDAGSFLIHHMVKRAMVERRAPSSVESAFAFAHDEIAREYPEHLPSISDGYPGDLALGPMSVARSARYEKPARDDAHWSAWEASDQGEAEPIDDSSPAESSEEPSRRSGWGVCGSVRYNC